MMDLRLPCLLNDVAALQGMRVSGVAAAKCLEVKKSYLGTSDTI